MMQMLIKMKDEQDAAAKAREEREQKEKDKLLQLINNLATGKKGDN